MASVRREFDIGISAEKAWAAIRDVAATQRVFPGVLTDCHIEDGARIVTFANGMVVREWIVEVDDAARRLVYAVVGGRMAHHNASLQVIEGGLGNTRVVWLADFLPDTMKPAIEGMTEQGVLAMQRAFAQPVA